jgi:fructoselysine-6-P-deglycase FrlB-like protein
VPTVRDYLHEQTRSVRVSTTDLPESIRAEINALVARTTLARLIFVGSGTSGFAAAAIAAWAERSLPGVSVRVSSPTEPLYYWPDSAFGPEALVVAVSQSGRSRMVLDVVERAAATGARTMMVTGDIGRPTAADLPVDIRCGEESVGAKTKGYTSTIVTLRQIVATIAGTDPAWGDVTGAVDSALETGPPVEQFSRQINSSVGIAILGSGPHLATAREAALKIAEIARIPVEAFDVEEYVHGPHRRLTGETAVVVIAVDSSTFERTVAVVQWLTTATGRVLVVTDRPDSFTGTAVTIVPINAIGEDTSTVPAIIPLQLLALACAAGAGVDPEEPLYAEVDALLARKVFPT